MKVKRVVASLPVRSARETWEAIVKLITGSGSVDIEQLTAATSVISTAIADEYAIDVPIVVKGIGARLVIYTAHGTDAMELGTELDQLTWNPTAGDGWRITVPCDAEDVGWMNTTLKSRAPRISVHDMAERVDEDDPQRGAQEIEINWGALTKS